MHTTQSLKDIHHYFTTFYINIIEPFVEDKNYKSFKNELEKC